MKIMLSVTCLLAGLFVSSCGGGNDATTMERTWRGRHKKDTVAFVNPTRLGDHLIKKAGVATGFQFPVGRPDGKGGIDTAGFFKARGYLGTEHPGEDWNRFTGGNSDIGKFVFAVADGVVFFSSDIGEGWGPVVRMVHNYGTAREPKFVESVYAHLNTCYVQAGNRLKRGDVIGTIGNANGKYHAHLHFEMRLDVGKDINAGLKGDTAGYVDPTQFIVAHPPVKKPSAGKSN